MAPQPTRSCPRSQAPVPCQTHRSARRLPPPPQPWPLRWSPRQIWLFGSRARGEATDASDWDLLVVLDDRTLDAELDPRVAWQLGRNAGVRADVIACRAGEFQEARDTPNTLAYDAAHEGGLLYER